MFVNYHNLIQQLIGKSVLKPLSGTLSGHAAGEPFDKFVYQEIKKQYPSHTFRQFEYLNDLYSKNPTVIGHQARQALFNSPSVLFLLSVVRIQQINGHLKTPLKKSKMIRQIFWW